MNRRVEFTKDVVIKVGDPAVMRIEESKMRVAREIGLASGAFTVPEVVDFDATLGRLVMERIHGLVSLRRLKGVSANYSTRIEEAAVALAVIHAGLSLPVEMTIPLPAEVEGDGPKAFLHGDYSLENVCVSDRGQGRLTLIDWSMTPMHGGYASFGVAYFDVVWLVNNMFSRPAYTYLTNGDPAPLARRFIQSYFDATGRRAEPEFFAYQRDFVEFKIGARRRSNSLAKRLLMAHGHGAWRKFAKEPDGGML